MDAKDNPLETPATFLAALADSLRENEGVDAGLIAILKAHILQATPAQDAVAQAKAAILALADERAAGLQRGAADV